MTENTEGGIEALATAVIGLAFDDLVEALKAREVIKNPNRNSSTLKEYKYMINGLVYSHRRSGQYTEQELDDYLKIKYAKATDTVKEIEKFFRSGQSQKFCETDGEYFIQKAYENVQVWLNGGKTMKARNSGTTRKISNVKHNVDVTKIYKPKSKRLDND